MRALGHLRTLQRARILQRLSVRLRASLWEPEDHVTGIKRP